MRTSGGEHSSTSEISTDIFYVWQRATDSPLFCLANASPHKGGRVLAVTGDDTQALCILPSASNPLSSSEAVSHTANGNRSRFSGTGGTSESLWLNPAATPISSVLLTGDLQLAKRAAPRVRLKKEQGCGKRQRCSIKPRRALSVQIEGNGIQRQE